MLIHDCQYTDTEYPEHVGWGHSPVSDALGFAHRVSAKRVLLFHHDPLHSDDFLDTFGGEIGSLWQGSAATRRTWSSPPSATRSCSRTEPPRLPERHH